MAKAKTITRVTEIDMNIEAPEEVKFSDNAQRFLTSGKDNEYVECSMSIQRKPDGKKWENVYKSLDTLKMNTQDVADTGIVWGVADEDITIPKGCKFNIKLSTVDVDYAPKGYKLTK
jgi:hypothetical protein